MIVLGIESTAHTFGIALLDSKKVLANCKRSYTTLQGGMIPAKVADHHIKVYDEVLRDALTKAGIKLDQIDLIAYSRSPGLGHTLRIGAGAARSLALLLDKPLVGVNHCIAHLEIGRMLTKAKDPVLLYASGANTQVIAFEGGRYRIFGETLDMGIGNFLDSTGRLLDLGFPAGMHIEKAALQSPTKDLIPLPYSVKGMDVSFGGLYTKIKTLLNDHPNKAQLCYSIQETVFAMLVEVAERALAHCQKNELVLGGGVACNKRLQSMCETMCKARGVKFFAPPNEFLVDNAAMIAWTGQLLFKQGKTLNPTTATIDPYERTDEVI